MKRTAVKAGPEAPGGPAKEPAGEKGKRAAAIAVFLVLLAVSAFLLYRSRSLYALLADREAFKEAVSRLGLWGPAIIVLLEILLVMVTVVPVGPLNIAAGYVYGLIGGTVLCLIGNTLGSMVVFFLVRKFGKSFVLLFVSEEAFERHSRILEHPRMKLLLLAAFAIPGMPKDVFAYLSGLTDLTAREWFLIAALGRLPSILVSVGFGNAAYRSDGTAMVLILAVAGAALAAAALWRRRKKQDGPAGPRNAAEGTGKREQ